MCRPRKGRGSGEKTRIDWRGPEWQSGRYGGRKLRLGFVGRCVAFVGRRAKAMASGGGSRTGPQAQQNAVSLKPIEVPQPLVNGEKFIKWDEVRNQSFPVNSQKHSILLLYTQLLFCIAFCNTWCTRLRFNNDLRRRPTTTILLCIGDLMIMFAFNRVHCSF